jgi:hypothetical protein
MPLWLLGGGKFSRGANEMRELLSGLLASGLVFHAGEQYPAILNAVDCQR